MLFTSYLVVTAVMMLVTGWVSSRIGAKRTLVVGLILIVVFSALAGTSGSIDGIVGFRAGWGLGNALFIATSLAVIVGSASGGFAGAIVLYETALGVGIACGPLLGGLLGNISWRDPFFGVAVLMVIALIATLVLLKKTPRRLQRASAEPIKALRHRSLATTSVVGLLYNWGFFTLLGYSPFLMHLSPLRLGAVFCGWGSPGGALRGVRGAVAQGPVRHAAHACTSTSRCWPRDLAVIGIWPDHRWIVIVAVIAAGAFLGVNNTLVTTAVMSIAPVERPVASATYGFVRFIGGGLAPFVAAKLVEHYNAHVPFILGGVTVAAGALVLSTVHSQLTAADAEETQPGPSHERIDAETAVFEVPGLEEEAILADEALREDRALDGPR